MDKAAVKRISKSISKTVIEYFNNIDRTYVPYEEQLKWDYIPAVDTTLVEETQTLIATALLMGIDHATRKINSADTEIPPLPFEEAVSFMKGRIPMTKTDWNELEPKLRFRAFTVARLAQCDFIETVRGRLINAMEKGEGFASTWSDIKAIAEADGALQFKPGYWENVFRTNTQTAYTAGKLMQYRNNPPPAWRLLVVEDSRTSDICQALLREGKTSIAIASDHSFWSSVGYPPYHFQCRTGLQAVSKSEIEAGAEIENPDMKEMKFKPMEGFGGNPLENGNYWMMTKGMFERGLKYGIINEFNQLDNIVKDFDSVWKGYTREKIGKGWVDIHETAKLRDEFYNNYETAKKMASEGDRIKILPVHDADHWRSPDYLKNASLWELETRNGSHASIDGAIRDGQKQALNLIIQLPENANRTMVLKTIYNRFTRKDSPARIRNLIVFWGNKKDEWTADEIRSWKPL